MWVYDNNGSYIGFTYNGVEYYYVYNLQGDVEAITDAEGTIVAKYRYDEWGYVDTEANYNGSVNIAQINPIRYRGYYYDSERGFYYLNSRYYDPFMCRFINADAFVSTGQGFAGYNMFAYCGNNPVTRVDPTGTCYYSADGRWCHDNWEYLGGYVRKPEPNSSNSSAIALNDFKNEDGSYSLYDNRRHDSDNLFHEQILSVKGSKPSFSLKNGKVTLGSISATFINGGWEFENLDLSLLDLGHAKLAAGYENGQLDITAMASTWAPSVTVKIWDINITLAAHVGSVGGKLNVGSGKFDVGGAYGWGASLSVEW